LANFLEIFDNNLAKIDQEVLEKWGERGEVGKGEGPERVGARVGERAGERVGALPEGRK
jgi:hypothetical protein